MSGIFGAEPLTSDIVLFLELCILVILLVMLKFRSNKTKQYLSKHHNTMLIVIVIALLGTIFVMIPSFFNFISGGIDLLSLGTFSTILHASVGVFAFTFGIVSTLNIKPRRLRRWMRITMVFWLVAIVLGITIFLQVALR